MFLRRAASSSETLLGGSGALLFQDFFQNTTKANMGSFKFILASHLREIRKAKGMRQKEVAEILGESQSKISAIETGERSPDLETFMRFVIFRAYP